jgi:aminoglycoside phosphotransferase (APT) family kinase protein
MEDVIGGPEDPGLAANRLGGWQANSELPDLGWLTSDQLSQRLAVTHLDWSAVDADGRAVGLWRERAQVLDRLRLVPRVLSHGDFGVGNLVHSGDDTVVVDWGTLGSAAVGSDLAYLALSTLTDLRTEYLAGLGQRYPDDAVMLGYQATIALVGVSRLHWMLMAGHDVPTGYIDFIWDNRPRM